MEKKLNFKNLKIQAFWYPKGAHIYNAMINFIRTEYRKRGLQEVNPVQNLNYKFFTFQVITPNIYNAKLWEQSGHWHHYADNMFK